MASKRTSNEFVVETTRTLPKKSVQGLLVSAFEGGSNYWYGALDYDFGDSGLTLADFRKGGSMTDPDDYFHPCQIVPFAEGCAVTLEVQGEPGRERLDLDAIKRGLERMALTAPEHFNNIDGPSEDATTGDVFLQCCLFGEVIFG
ncbi:MAG TPA: hypothetical protein VFH61_07285 [Thermoleophilia bacterium]|nr:hypothetical protein [Thermoleophilia bacterium]